MTTVYALMTELEQAGGTLTLTDGKPKVCYPDSQRDAVASIVRQLRQHREEVARLLKERSTRTAGAPVIPEGAILVAPRFDSKPTEEIPVCWCCGTSYCLEKTQQWEGKTYAWLKPGCKCLDTPQAIKCCGLCTGHCTCNTRQEANNCPKVSSG